MIREQLAIKHHARDIDAKTVDYEKHIEGSDSDAQAGFVGARVGELRDHGCFETQHETAAGDAAEHEWAPPETVHDGGAEEIGGDGAGYPATLQDELVAGVETKVFVESWALGKLRLVA
jgi:hypothetical protein